jgi:hypothetical protein
MRKRKLQQLVDDMEHLKLPCEERTTTKKKENKKSEFMCTTQYSPGNKRRLRPITVSKLWLLFAKLANGGDGNESGEVDGDKKTSNHDLVLP